MFLIYKDYCLKIVILIISLLYIIRFVPTRPEECGMYWLPRRKDFDVTKWRAPCKCNHTHEDHNPNPPFKCGSCQCYSFNSYFACISCDQSWENH